MKSPMMIFAVVVLVLMVAWGATLMQAPKCGCGA